MIDPFVSRLSFVKRKTLVRGRNRGGRVTLITLMSF